MKDIEVVPISPEDGAVGFVEFVRKGVHPKVIPFVLRFAMDHFENSAIVYLEALRRAIENDSALIEREKMLAIAETIIDWILVHEQRYVMDKAVALRIQALVGWAQGITSRKEEAAG